MANTIQHGFWGQGNTDSDEPYIAALAGGSVPGDASTPLGQLKYYQYRTGRTYDFFRWRQGQGFQINGNRCNPSVKDIPDAKFLLSQNVDGHTADIGCEGTIIALELSWRTNNPSVVITAASIINGNFDFGPYGRMVSGVSDNRSNNVDAAPRWAARPQTFTAPTQGVSYGARSYTGGNFPSNNSWQSSFNPNSKRSGSGTTGDPYVITAGSGSLQGTVGTKDCYSLFETGLDILYLTSLYPNAVFMLEHVLEVNLSHGGGGADYPKSDGSGAAGSLSTLGEANYSDAVYHIISFFEAMGITNIIYQITLGGLTRFDGAVGVGTPNPNGFQNLWWLWWRNILAQEKNDPSIGALSKYDYDTGRTWVHLAGHDIYSGLNGVGFNDPFEMNNSKASNPTALEGVSNWCDKYDKYFTLWTTGITFTQGTDSDLSSAPYKWPKDGNLQTTLNAGTLNNPARIANGTSWFSAAKLVGDLEMEKSGSERPRYWGCLYQMTYETQGQTPFPPGQEGYHYTNDYLPESDSLATHTGNVKTGRGVNTGTQTSVYGNATTAGPGYDPTHRPTNGRKGWIAYWDWVNGTNWKGGTPMLLPDTGSGSKTGKAAMTGTGSLTASGISVRPAAAAITGTGTLASAGVVVSSKTAEAALVGSGTLVAVATVEHSNPASSATYGQAVYGTAVYGVTIVPSTITASAALTGAGTLEAIAVKETSGSAALSGTGSLAASYVREVIGSAALVGSGSSAAEAGATGLVTAEAALQGFGDLTGRSYAEHSGEAALVGTGILQAAAFPETTNLHGTVRGSAKRISEVRGHVIRRYEVRATVRPAPHTGNAPATVRVLATATGTADFFSGGSATASVVAFSDYEGEVGGSGPAMVGAVAVASGDVAPVSDASWDSPSVFWDSPDTDWDE